MKVSQPSKTEKGFTLIELLVVIAIIGLLASIILASLNSARGKGRDARRIADVREIQSALELYMETCKGQYPKTLTAAANNGPCPGSTNFGTFLSSVPTDPATGVGYPYAAIGSGVSCTSYHLAAVLEAKPGTGTSAACLVNKTVCTGGGYTPPTLPNTINGKDTLSVTNGDFDESAADSHCATLGALLTNGSYVYDVGT